MPAARSVDDVYVSTVLPTTGLRIKIKKVSSAKLVSLAAEHKGVVEAEMLHGNNTLLVKSSGRTYASTRKIVKMFVTHSSHRLPT